MKKAISVALEYWGHWRSEKSEDYWIKEISGAVTVEVQAVDDRTVWITARVGEMISEAQADELSKRVNVITRRKSERGGAQ